MSSTGNGLTLTNARDAQEEGEMPREVVKYAKDVALAGVNVPEDINWEDAMKVPPKMVGDELSLCWGKGREPVQLRYQHRGGPPNIDQYIDLSRSDINRLIRTLRKARDQAFGRDE
jgi:hypothetical protein